MWIALGEYRGRPCIKGFVRYLVGRYNKQLEERFYRTYVTDSLRLMPQMKYLTTRWADAMGYVERDERTAEEIIDDVLGRLEEE